jgi:septum formation protein
MKLILASNSPRRKELLRNAGFDFEVRPSRVEEGQPSPGEMAEEFARRNARAKALSVAVNLTAGNLVLGADTVVTINGLILGKPRGPYDATRMLRLLSGQTHQVITGICLVKAPEDVEALKHETTFVTFAELSEDEIRGYIASQEPYDKAGAYAIQGWASRWVTRISGCYFNVVGLPISLLWDMLKNFPKPTTGGKNPPGL